MNGAQIVTAGIGLFILLHRGFVLLRQSEGLLKQVRGYGKSVFRRDSFLNQPRIVAVDRVVKHLIK